MMCLFGVGICPSAVQMLLVRTQSGAPLDKLFKNTKEDYYRNFTAAQDTLMKQPGCSQLQKFPPHAMQNESLARNHHGTVDYVHSPRPTCS